MANIPRGANRNVGGERTRAEQYSDENDLNNACNEETSLV